MSDQENRDPQGKKEGSKFNFWWLYGIIGVFFIVVYVFSEMFTPTKEISRRRSSKRCCPQVMYRKSPLSMKISRRYISTPIL
jgi:hypothetical protein